MNTLHELVEVVLQHRQWRSLARATYEEVRLDIERQICEGMPPGFCHAEKGEEYQPFEDKARGITLESLLDASAAAIRFIKSGGQMVSREESQRRAEICRGCRFNRPSPCAVCTPAFKAIEGLIPRDRMEPGLSACGICGCSLAAKVLLPLHPDGLRYPPICWQHGQT
jgi:hypothetical protein